MPKLTEDILQAWNDRSGPVVLTTVNERGIPNAIANSVATDASFPFLSSMKIETCTTLILPAFPFAFASEIDVSLIYHTPCQISAPIRNWVLIPSTRTMFWS